MVNSSHSQFAYSESIEPSMLAGLTREQKQRLSNVLDDYLRSLEKGMPPSTEAVTAANPDLAEALIPYLESLTGLHDVAAAFGGHTDDLHETPSVNDERRLGDFVLLHEIGRGGMGVVYEARQVSLARRVALKVLPFAAVLDARQISRFKNEAQAAAQLQHPNIVPVYAVGVERGVHYYAMQFIDGQSLDRAIAQLRVVAGIAPTTLPETKTYCGNESSKESREKNSSLHGQVAFLSTKWTSRQVYIESVIRLGIQAADALHTAHSFGVVHRDIKPSNLLLDATGKLWVTDFGLARCQSDLSLTQTGDVVGTRQYMSPEQALGQAALVDQRTDIYSLGATLYELLTLRPAFGAKDTPTLLARIDRDEPARIRSLQPSVPVDLETVVNKAMARDRDERYVTAQEFADDLRRLLDGQSPVAQRPTLFDRSVKWARRHRRSVTLGMFTASIALVGLTLGILIINQARTRAEFDSARAERYLKQAQETVDLFGSHFAEQLGHVPGAEQVRSEVLAETLAYYRQFVDQVGDNPELTADLAMTYGKIGSLNDQMGLATEAVEAHQQAARLLSQLADEHPESAHVRSQLAVAENNLALALGHAGKSNEARHALHKAIELQRQLVQEDPAVWRYEIELVASHNNLGSQLRDDGNRSGAAEEFQAAIRRGDIVLAKHPENTAAASSLAAAYNNLAALESTTVAGEPVDLYRRAAELRRRVMEAQPAELKYQSELATTLNNLGAAQARRNRLREAASTYREAIQLQKDVLRIVPLDRTFRRDLAVTYNNLGLTHARLREPEEAQRCFRNALGFQQQLVAEQPDDAELQSSLGGMFNNLGIVLEGWGKNQDAAESFSQAIEHQKRALRNTPNVGRYRTFLGKHYHNYGRTLRSLGRMEEAFDMALARKALCQNDPEQLLAVAEEFAIVGSLPDGSAVAARSTELAIKTLREAVAAGLPSSAYDNRDAFAQLKNHPDFVGVAKGQGTRE